MKAFSVKKWKIFYNAINMANKAEDFVRVRELKKDVSAYLDSCGLKLPAQKYPYNKDDINTWKYLPTPNTKEYEDYKEMTILNPDWIYKEQSIANGDY